MATRATKAAIERAGRAVLRREGVGGVTMRAVAGRLDLTPMALYRVVDTADDLRMLAVDSALREIADPAGRGTVEDRLRDWATAARGALARYPGLAEACLTDWPSLPEGARILESLLAVAADHTDVGREQVAIANAVFVYVLTRVIAERAVLARGRRRKLPAVEADPARFPRLAAAQGYFAAIDTDRHFAIGIDALLSGLLRGDR